MYPVLGYYWMYILSTSAAVAHQADILDELEAHFIYTHLAVSEDLYHVLFSLFFSIGKK